MEVVLMNRLKTLTLKSKQIFKNLKASLLNHTTKQFIDELQICSEGL